MACVNDRNQLNASAKKLLQALKVEAKSPQDLGKLAGLPLFKVRRMLRELKTIEFVKEEDGAYSITEKGEEALQN